MKKIEFSKKEILRYITENELELSEFAQKQKNPCARIKLNTAKNNMRAYTGPNGESLYRIKAGEKIVPASSGRWFCSEVVPDVDSKDFKMDDVPNYWIQNKTGKFEDSLIVFPLNGMSEIEYKQKYDFDLGEVRKLYPEIPQSQFIFVPNKKPFLHQQGLKPYGLYVDSTENKNDPSAQRSKAQREAKGQSHTQKEIENILLRAVNKTIRKHVGEGHLFGDGDSSAAIQFNEKLVDLGIPEIYFNREAKTSVRKISNQEIYIKLFNATYHKDFASFQQYAADRIDVIRGDKYRNEVPKVQTVQQPRQEIPVRNTWDMSRPMQRGVEYTPTTKYGTHKKGYRPEPFNIGIRNVFTILGELVGDNFNWTVTMTVSVYKKLEDEMYLKNKQGEVVQLSRAEGEFDPEYGTKIEAKKSVYVGTVNLDEPITETRPIVLDGLSIALQDFKNEVENLDQNLILDLANFGEFDISNANFDDDDMLEEMVNKVIKNLRRL